MTDLARACGMRRGQAWEHESNVVVTGATGGGHRCGGPRFSGANQKCWCGDCATCAYRKSEQRLRSIGAERVSPSAGRAAVDEGLSWQWLDMLGIECMGGPGPIGGSWPWVKSGTGGR